MTGQGIAAGLLLALLPGLAAAQCLCLQCVLPNYENFRAAGEAMAPTLESGACAVATRVDAVRTPPARGDVIVFRHPVNGATFVSRVVAVGGDRVALAGGALRLNGAELPRAPLPSRETPYAPDPVTGSFPLCRNAPSVGGICRTGRFRETLPGGRAYEVLDAGPGRLDDMPERTVPEGHLFVLGDHRDNALDSRSPRARGGVGFLPLETVIGIFEDLD